MVQLFQQYTECIVLYSNVRSAVYGSAFPAVEKVYCLVFKCLFCSGLFLLFFLLVPFMSILYMVYMVVFVFLVLIIPPVTKLVVE